MDNMYREQYIEEKLFQKTANFKKYQKILKKKYTLQIFRFG